MAHMSTTIAHTTATPLSRASAVSSEAFAPARTFTPAADRDAVPALLPSAPLHWDAHVRGPRAMDLAPPMQRVESLCVRNAGTSLAQLLATKIEPRELPSLQARLDVDLAAYRARSKAVMESLRDSMSPALVATGSGPPPPLPWGGSKLGAGLGCSTMSAAADDTTKTRRPADFCWWILAGVAVGLVGLVAVGMTLSSAPAVAGLGACAVLVGMGLVTYGCYSWSLEGAVGLAH